MTTFTDKGAEFVQNWSLQ